MSNQIPHSPDRPIPTRAELIRTVASALADWEDTGELYTPFAIRLVEFVLAPQHGLRERVHVSDNITT
jgi:hypothetical protein